MAFRKLQWFKISIISLSVFTIAVSILIATAYTQQDHIVNEMISRLNHDFEGRIAIKDSHISPFTNFPYISIDFEDLKIYESKADTSVVLMQVADTYVGFDFWSVINGSFQAKKIKMQNGFLKLIQHVDGSFNIANALSTEDSDDQENDGSTHLDLQAIELINLDVLKINENSNMLLEAFIEEAQSSVSITDEDISMAFDSKFLFNLILDGDTSFLHHKHVEFQTALTLHTKENILEINPSEVLIENALFLMEGSVDVDDDMNLDLKFSGSKPNFDLFLAFAPAELAPMLSRYDNGGKIYFDATIKGPSINNQAPQINVDFGCSEAFVNNLTADKTVNDLYFEGHFTNGEKRDPSTMELVIKDFTAKPETGIFNGNMVVKNFESPEFNIQLFSEFDLDFLARFLDFNNLEEVSGSVFLEMNFHDIIDLSQPERSIERLNESYFTRLKVENLNVRSSEYPLPIKNVNINVQMDGHQAVIDQLDFEVGRSNMSIKANVSDLPAIIHHSNLPIEAVLDIKSTMLDIEELTYASLDSTASFNEQIKDLSMRFTFKSLANAFTESPNLPLGEFFIEKLHAQLTHYPHELHDFNADVFIDTANFRIIDFTGMIDQSDFHFKGKLENYDLWFEEEPIGDTRVDFNLSSDLLQLEDLFSYQGENHVPEDYRHEEFSGLHIHGLADMKFEKKLVSTTIAIDKLETQMKVHPMRFENFKGSFYMDSTLLRITDAGGTLGNSDFRVDFTHYLIDSLAGQPDYFSLASKRLDFDQLFAYNPPRKGQEIKPEDHEAGFNIFEVPFSNMDVAFDIQDLNYHRYHLNDFKAKGRMQEDHYVYLDTLSMNAAGGSLGVKGYFNGSDPKAIYFSPDMQVNHIDLDKLLFKFENFGQDHLVSENLHGSLSGTIKGKIHLHADMVPIIDDSDLHIELSILNGSINNYAAFEALSNYFSDKNLSNIRFDTLQNILDFNHGALSIPSMSINSTIGYFEVSGKQKTDLSMEYYVRIPMKVITQAGLSKVFGKKDQGNTDQVDEIQYQNKEERTKFLNLLISGTPDDYKIKLAKDKSR